MKGLINSIDNMSGLTNGIVRLDPNCRFEKSQLPHLDIRYENLHTLLLEIPPRELTYILEKWDIIKEKIERGMVDKL